MHTNRRNGRAGCAAACLTIAFASGCGGAAAGGAPPTCITSATVAADEQGLNAKMNQVAAERDSAKQDLALALQQATLDREESQRKASAVVTYIDFESAVYSRLDHVDARTKDLETLAARSSGERRAKLDKLVRAVATSEEKVQRDMRRIHTVPEVDWTTFQRDIDTTLDAIDRDFQEAETIH
ncbi:MAG: hypothetical protein ACLQVI_40105 [Polyangiaceae bacterium]|jgi:hypothetical protein